MKLFVVSDIHGYYNILIKELNDAKFDQLNPNHLLIVVGDLFDRGPNSKEVYEYLKDLHDKKKAIIIKGNHDKFIEELFEGNHKRVLFNCIHNGFDETLISLFNLDYINYNDEDVKNLDKEIYEFVRKLPLYYETKNYIFVHAGIDPLIENWKNTDEHTLLWDSKFYSKKVNNTSKKVIFGHTRTNQIRKFLALDKFDFSFYEKTDKIGIDTNVVISDRIGVLILDDDLLSEG